MDNKILKNYFYNIGYQIINMIIPLITTPYVTRILGADTLGVYTYSSTIVQYFVLFGNLGLDKYAQREIAYTKDSSYKMSKAFYELIFIRLILLFVNLFIFSCLVINSDNVLLYTIQGIQIISSGIDVVWFFQGIEDFKKVILRNTICKILIVSLIFVLVKKPNDLLIYAAIYSIASLLTNIYVLNLLKKYLIKVPFKNIEIKRHLKGTIQLFLPQVASSVYLMLDKLMIGYFCPKDEVSFYDLSERIVKLAMTLITTFGTVMLPRVANLHINNKHFEIKNKLYQSFQLVFVLGIPMVFGIVGITNNFVPLFLGAGFDPIKSNMIFLSSIIVIIGMSNVIATQYLIPTNNQNKYTFSVFVGAIINFLLNLILIIRYKSLGATISTIVAELSILIIMLYFTRKVFDYKKIFKFSLKPLAGAIIMFFLIKSIELLQLNQLLTLILQLLFGSNFYILYCFIIKLNPVSEIICKFLNTLKKYLSDRKTHI